MLFFLWLFACNLLVTSRLTRRSPNRGEERKLTCRTIELWNLVQNHQLGPCRRSSFWAWSPSVVLLLAGMHLRSWTARTRRLLHSWKLPKRQRNRICPP